jgi:hypothetical protein
MALNSNAFVEGIDPTGTFGGYASVLLQLIRQALPSSTYGMVLYDSATPNVAGANAWRQRCVWLDMTDTAKPVAKIYRTTGSPGWVSVNSLISNNTITTAMIQNAAVTLAKLSVSGGAANQLIRVNAGATAFEFVNFLDMVTAGIIPISSLKTSTLPPGELRVAAGDVTGGAAWYTIGTMLNSATPGSMDLTVIAPYSLPATQGVFARCALGDATAVWSQILPDDDFADNSIKGRKLDNQSVTLAKLNQSSATTGQVATWNGADWVAATPSSTTFYSGTGAVPTTLGSAAATSFTHGLGAVPRIVDVQLRCVTGESGYVTGDYLPLTAVQGTNGAPVLTTNRSSTTVTIQRNDNGTGPYIPNKTTGLQLAAFTSANWELVVNCIK